MQSLGVTIIDATSRKLSLGHITEAKYALSKQEGLLGQETYKIVELQPRNSQHGVIRFKKQDSQSLARKQRERLRIKCAIS